MKWSVDEIDTIRKSPFAEDPEVLASDISTYLIRSSQATLFQLYRHSRKPIESEMISAAAKFFHVFYLKESLLEYSPRTVLVACMNLAAKTEEYHAVSLSDLVNALPNAAELKAQIPRVEMKLLAALDYDLTVEQPWLIQLFWVEQIRREDDDVHLKVYDVACDLMRIWQWTDAVLLFSFPQLATAAVYKACIQLTSALPGPEEETENAMSRLMAAMNELIPSINIADLVTEIEAIANRLGQFERLLKDPGIGKTEGFMRLSQLHSQS